jgi:hypothetical protein
MKKIIYSILIIFICTGLFSCKKFLDEKPVHSLVDANAITNFETGKSAVGGIYATFENDDWAGALYTSFSTKSGFVNFNDADYKMTYTQLTPSYSSLGIWTQFYTSLNAANFAIQGISALSEDKVPSEEEKNALIGEARCLRAWINANILWTYGHWWGDDEDKYGLLYRDEPVDLSNVQQPRLTVGESYQKIFEDLDFAIANLKDFSTSRYVSKQFAEVLKAKLLLYRGGYRNTSADLQASLALVNEVLANHPGSFAMESDLNDVYKNSWDSKECLFARYLEDDGSRNYSGGYYYTYYLSQIGGDKLPLAPGDELTAGLEYGIDWFKADPRWDIATGPVRSAETWDDSYHYTFKKVARLGQYAGHQSSDPNAEKYTAYYFRFSELYLMKAELLARTGASVAEAIAPINEMRSLRTAQAFSPLTPSSHDELMDMIFKEIFLENFMENGSEFFAAVRFQHIGQPWIVTIKAANSVAFEENKMCWPIPDAEMVNNPLMEQNPDE